MPSVMTKLITQWSPSIFATVELSRLVVLGLFLSPSIDTAQSERRKKSKVRTEGSLWWFMTIISLLFFVPKFGCQVSLCSRYLFLHVWTPDSSFKKHWSGPGCCGSVDWAPACEPKGHQFDCQSGYMSGLWTRCPVGGAWEIHGIFSPSLSPSLSRSLKINKILNFFLKKKHWPDYHSYFEGWCKPLHCL